MAEDATVSVIVAGSGYRELSSHSEVGQLGLTLGVQQDVPGLDVPVDLPHEVQVLQTLQGGVQDGGDLLFRQLTMAGRHTHTHAQKTFGLFQYLKY